MKLLMNIFMEISLCQLIWPNKKIKCKREQKKTYHIANIGDYCKI